MTPLAALEADPFLPAVEWLQAHGKSADDLPVMRLLAAHHSRPIFELIPDHETLCNCDKWGWRP